MDEIEMSKIPAFEPKYSVKQRIGKRIRELRIERGLTQQQLAERAGIDRSFLSDLERGVKEGSATTLHSIALAFSMNLSELLKGI